MSQGPIYSDWKILMRNYIIAEWQLKELINQVKTKGEPLMDLDSECKRPQAKTY
jgi:hypothetical protein